MTTLWQQIRAKNSAPWDDDDGPAKAYALVILGEGSHPLVKRGWFSDCKAWANACRTQNPFAECWIKCPDGWIRGEWAYGNKQHLWANRAESQVPSEALMAEIMTQ